MTPAPNGDGFRPNFAIDGENLRKGRLLTRIGIIDGGQARWVWKVQIALIVAYMGARYWLTGGYRRQKLLAHFLTEPVLECQFDELSATVDIPESFRSQIWHQILTDGKITEYLGVHERTADLARIVFRDGAILDHGSLTHRLAGEFGGLPVKMSALDWMTAVVENGRELVDWPAPTNYERRETLDYGQVAIARLAKSDRVYPKSDHFLP